MDPYTPVYEDQPPLGERQLQQLHQHYQEGTSDYAIREMHQNQSYEVFYTMIPKF